MKKVAVVQKCPKNSEFNLNSVFDFDFDKLYLTDRDLPKVLVKDVTLSKDIVNKYDYVILVGSEAMKFFTGRAGVVDAQGSLLRGKLIPLINPAMLYFKPDMRPGFEIAVRKIHDYINLGVTDERELVLLTEEDEILSYLDRCLTKNAVAVDTETTALYPRDGHVICITMCCELHEGIYIPAESVTIRVEEKMQEVFNTCKIVFHNAKFDIHMLRYHFNFSFPNVEDTMLMHYVLDENNTHALKPLAVKYTPYGNYDEELDEWKKSFMSAHGINKRDFDYGMIPFEVLYPYAATDPCATLFIYTKFRPIIEGNSQLEKVYREILIPGMNFLVDMEDNGCPVDVERLKEAEAVLTEEIFSLKESLYQYPQVETLEELQGAKFNPNSVAQLRTLFFTVLKLTPSGLLTDGGLHSTDEEALEALAEQHPIPNIIKDIRKKTKILSTYICKMQRGVDADGRLRTNFNQHVTTSGRLSSSGKLNLQQLPREDKWVKYSIKARDGFVIVSADLGTAEMYYVSVLSKDPKLQAVFENGGDFHTETAVMCFGLSVPEDVTDRREFVETYYPGKRQAAKAISFGILYGSGPGKVAEMAKCSRGDAEKYIEIYFQTYSVLAKWLKRSQDSIRKNGFIYSALGRKRRVPNVKSPSKEVSEHAVRSATNFLVQSVASDMNFLGAIDLHNRIKELKKSEDIKIFALVHDSILAEVREDCVEEYTQEVRSCLQKDRGLSIKNSPISVDINIGKDYKEAA